MQEMLIGEIYQDLEVIMANNSFSASLPSNNTRAEHLSLQVIKLFYNLNVLPHAVANKNLQAFGYRLYRIVSSEL